MEEKISLKDLFRVLKKRLSIIIIITAIATATSGIISYFFITPTYQSSTQLLVNQSKGEQETYNYNEVQTNLQLINTYNVIIKSPAILDKVIESEKLDINAGELNQLISVDSEQNSQVIKISVQNESPQLASSITNAVAATFKEEITKIMKVDTVTILTKAELGENPVKPKPVINMLIALVVGSLVGVGLVFLQEYLDNTINTEQDIEKQLGLPVLGAIMTIDMESESKDSMKSSSMRRTRGESFGS